MNSVYFIMILPQKARLSTWNKKLNEQSKSARRNSTQPEFVTGCGSLFQRFRLVLTGCSALEGLAEPWNPEPWNL